MLWPVAHVVASENLGVMRQAAIATLEKPGISQSKKEEALETLSQAAIRENRGYGRALSDLWKLIIGGKIEKSEAIPWLERVASVELHLLAELTGNDPSIVSSNIRAIYVRIGMIGEA